MQTSSRSSTSSLSSLRFSASLSLLVSSSYFRKLWYTNKKKALSLRPVLYLYETRECFCFSYRYGPRQAYQITILHQNLWTEITTSGGLDQNVPQSFASQMDRWGRHSSCCTWDKTTESHHHTRKSSKVLTAFSKKKQQPLSITRATSAKNTKSG